MMYAVMHYYEVDGGYGDAIDRADVVFVTPDKDFAEAYAKKWDRNIVYDHPYDDLTVGNLGVHEIYGPPDSLDVTPFDACNGYMFIGHGSLTYEEKEEEDDVWKERR